MMQAGIQCSAPSPTHIQHTPSCVQVNLLILYIHQILVRQGLPIPEHINGIPLKIRPYGRTWITSLPTGRWEEQFVQTRQANGLQVSVELTYIKHMGQPSLPQLLRTALLHPHPSSLYPFSIIRMVQEIVPGLSLTGAAILTSSPIIRMMIAIQRENIHISIQEHLLQVVEIFRIPRVFL